MAIVGMTPDATAQASRQVALSARKSRSARTRAATSRRPTADPSPARGSGGPGGVEDDDADAFGGLGCRRGLEAEDRAHARPRSVDCHGGEHTRSDRARVPAMAVAGTPDYEAMRRSSSSRYWTDSCSQAAVRDDRRGPPDGRVPCRRVVRDRRDGRRHRGGVARRVGPDGPRREGPLDQRQPGRHDRLAHRGVLVDLGRQAQVRELVPPGRGDPDVRGGHDGRHVVEWDAAVEGDALGDPELGRQRLECRLRIAPAVDVEPDVEVRSVLHERGHGTHRDVHLVGGRQAAGIDQSKRTVRPERAMRMGGRVESPERRAVDDDRDLVGRDAQPDESVAHRLVHGQRRRREGDRQPLLEQEQPVGDRVRGLRKAAPEELGHRFVQIQDDRHAHEAQRDRREHEVVGQRCHLGEGEPFAPMGPGRRPACTAGGSRRTRRDTSRGSPPGGAGHPAAGCARRSARPRRPRPAVGGPGPGRAGPTRPRPRPLAGLAGPRRSSYGRS